MPRIACLVLLLSSWTLLADDKADTQKAEIKRFSGTWKVVKGVADNMPLPDEAKASSRLIFDASNFTFKAGPVEQRTTFTVNAEKQTIEVAPPKGETKTLRGLYKFDGTKLTLVLTDSDKVPDKLEAGENRLYLELVRE